MTELLPEPKVLLFNIQDPVRRLRIRRWLEGAGIRPVEVPASALHQRVGALLELPGFSLAAGPWLGQAPAEEMLVMFGFRGSMLGDFLRFFREQGLAPVALKAMVTPSNLSWSALELYEALRQERAALARK